MHDEIYILFCAITLLFQQPLSAQTPSLLEKKISVRLTESTLLEGIEQVRKQCECNFIYSSDNFSNRKKISLALDSVPITVALQTLLLGTNLVYRIVDDAIILKIHENNNKPFARYTLHGKIKAVENGEEIIGATIAVKGSPIGTISNEFGFYSLTLPEGIYNIIVSSVGYQTQETTITLSADTILNFQLADAVYVLPEIVVSDSNTREDITSYKQLQMSNQKVNPKILQHFPTLLGEADPVKAIQLFPGVSSGTEGNAGFFVRGGGADQNLVLIDDAPIYSNSHLLGFFSIFNPDAIKEVELYKAGIPAKYGGRVSSVLDVRLKEGNENKRVLSGGIGSISSRINIEQPFYKGKGTFVVSGRRTYLDFLLRSLPQPLTQGNTFFFYDINLKSTYKINARNKIMVAYYQGLDKIGYEDYLINTWGNDVLSLRWNCVLNPKVFSNTTFYWSQFQAKKIDAVVSSLSALSRYGVRDLGIKHDFTYFLSNKLQFSIGTDLIYHRYNLGMTEPLFPASRIERSQTQPILALEGALYGNVEHELSQKLILQYGLRYSAFANIGEGKTFLYETGNLPQLTVRNIIDTVYYRRGQLYNRYGGWEPRLSLRFLVRNYNALKLSYMISRQYNHQLFNTTIPSPADMWAPVNRYIAPQTAQQIALGYYQNFRKNEYTASAEIYYKSFDNQVEFRPNANLIFNEHLETELLKGIGRAYGAEFFVRKITGKTQGWISYTISKSERKIEGINNYKWFPTAFDRRHNISIAMSRRIHKQIALSLTWIYASGVAYTVPAGRYEKDGYIVPYFTERNAFRLPDIHRLDVSTTFYRRLSIKHKNESSFNFSIYNLYGRRNTYAYIFRPNPESPSGTETVKIYLFTIIPSFTYSFKF
ncbi:MAG: TonB-dependent receptor [Cytophagales bacterium]|nr:TonB-dependent receptor [Cytophagales bacterium]MDW8383908.1 carboxypeptidase-like regulatory domain-containing protein [Flammeovirgaceae bacterium]